LVEILHVGMRRGAVQVEVVLLHILTVVALAVGQPKQPLLQDRILSVPERHSKAEPLFFIRNAGQAVLAPTVSARMRLLVAEVIPRIAILAVILPHSAPLALA